jgi:hypothetical protein
MRLHRKRAGWERGLACLRAAVDMGVNGGSLSSFFVFFCTPRNREMAGSPNTRASFCAGDLAFHQAHSSVLMVPTELEAADSRRYAGQNGQEIN